MKFGKQLENLAWPKFRGYYIQYKDVKKALKVITGIEKSHSSVQEVTHWTSSFLRLGPSPTATMESRLQEILSHELNRVNKFTQLQEEALRAQFQRLEEAMQKPDADPAELQQSLDELGEFIVHLRSYAMLNFTGFRKLVKKYDKWTNSKVLPWFMPQVAAAPLMNVDYDGFLARLNSIALRISKPSAMEAAPGPRRELIFWVDPKDTMRVKVQLAKNLNFSATAAGGAPRSFRTCATFFDAEESKCPRYRSFVVTGSDLGHGAKPSRPQVSSLHLRSDNEDAVCIVYEDVGGAQRVEVPLSHMEVDRFIEGNTSSKGTPAAQAALGSALSAMQEGQLKPLVQASYTRCVFHDSGIGMSATIDVDVRMGRVRTWNAAPSDSIGFPYDVLSVSVPMSAAEVPHWISSIYSAAYLFQVTGFTKAAHAISHFHAKSAGLSVPQWHSHMVSSEEGATLSGDEDDGGLQVTEKPVRVQRVPEEQPMNFGAAARPGHCAGPQTGGAMAAYPSPSAHLIHEFGAPTLKEGDSNTIDGQEMPRLPSDAAGLNQPLLGSKDPQEAQEGAFMRFVGRWTGQSEKSKPFRTGVVTVQPKSFYANERTLLEWVHLAVLSAMIGLVSMHASGHPTATAIGRCLVGMSIFIIVWALNTFNWRADALDRKEVTQYHDPYMPTIVVVGVMVMLSLSSLHAAGIVEFGIDPSH